MYGGDSYDSSELTKSQLAREKDILGAQTEIDKIFSSFTPEFYEKRQKAYMDYTMPQLAEQYQEAQKNLTYSLANRGLLRSSSAGQLATGLQKELSKQEQGLVDTSFQQRQQLQGEIADQQSRLMAQAMNSMDPSSAAVGAMRTAAQYQEPSTVAPLGNLFADWANIYSTNQMANAYNQYNPPLTFGAKSGGSGRNVYAY